MSHTADCELAALDIKHAQVSRCVYDELKRGDAFA
jgi:hypothetical protein